MRNAMYHIIYGNDAPAWATAAARGVLAGLLLGTQTGLATWTASGDLAVAAIAAANVFIGTIIVRFGIEGAVDAHKERKKR